jgi:uncharacterized protein (TIRG00374 family)
MSTTAKRLLIVVVAGVVVLAGFSVYADVSELGDRLAGFGWWAFAAALALALVNYVVRYMRWSLYLSGRGIDVPAPTSRLVFVAGFALSVTPGKIGELIKSYLLRATHGIPVTRTAPIVIAERVTDLGALLILGVIGVSIYGVARGMVLAGVAVVASGLLVLAVPTLANACIRLATWPKFLRKLRPGLVELYRELAELVRLWPLTWATAMAVVAWLGECIGFALIVSAFPGTAVPLGLAILIYAATTVAGALSFLPGGLLVTEATMTLFLVEASRGVDEPTAVAATILTRLATLWFAVVLGVIALAILRRRAPAVESALRAESESDTTDSAG